MSVLSPSFKYSESFYEVLHSGKNQRRALGSFVSWCCAVARGRHYLEEEQTTRVGLWMMESTRSLTRDGIGAVKQKARFER